MEVGTNEHFPLEIVFLCAGEILLVGGLVVWLGLYRPEFLKTRPELASHLSGGVFFASFLWIVQSAFAHEHPELKFVSVTMAYVTLLAMFNVSFYVRYKYAGRRS